MITKCPCNNCSTDIEFEAEDAGTVVTCPACGAETQLYLCKAPPRYPVTQDSLRRRRAVKTVLVIAGAFVVVALGALLAAFKEFLPQLVQAVGGTFAAAIVIVIALLILIWAALWILFPVFVYLLLTEMSKTLHRIEHNTRGQTSASQEAVPLSRP